MLHSKTPRKTGSHLKKKKKKHARFCGRPFRFNLSNIIQNIFILIYKKCVPFKVKQKNAKKKKRVFQISCHKCVSTEQVKHGSLEPETHTKQYKYD